jgi:hypothetical protein
MLLVLLLCAAVAARYVSIDGPVMFADNDTALTDPVIYREVRTLWRCVDHVLDNRTERVCASDTFIGWWWVGPDMYVVAGGDRFRHWAHDAAGFSKTARTWLDGVGDAPVVDASDLPVAGHSFFVETEYKYTDPWLRGTFCLYDGLLLREGFCAEYESETRPFWVMLGIEFFLVFMAAVCVTCAIGCGAVYLQSRIKMVQSLSSSTETLPPPTDTLPQETMFPIIPSVAPPNKEDV